jgi:hypothetical protein
MRHMVFWKDGVYISGSDVSSPFLISTKQPLISTPSLEQHRPTHTPATTPPNHSQQNTMHQSLLIALAAAATGALAGPLRRDTTSSAEYACNPAHAYPNGAQCVSTNGALSLVTPAPSTTAASTTGFACNPAHSYPNGAHCISTAGALSLVTPAPSSTGYACNPAHSYPNGAQCVSTAGTLSLVTPAPSSTGFACNPAHSYPEGVQCVSTNGALSLVTPTVSSSAKACKATSKATITAAASSAAASSAAQSAASAVSTKAASSGATVANGLTWTIENLSRYCASDKSGCDYNFNLTASDNRPAQACTIVRLDVKDAPTESWKDIACTANSPIKISWGYDAQFGAANAFATVVVVNEQEKAMAYFGVANINSQPVTAGNPYGSGLFGDVGPEPVYLL